MMFKDYIIFKIEDENKISKKPILSRKPKKVTPEKYT